MMGRGTPVLVGGLYVINCDRASDESPDKVRRPSSAIRLRLRVLPRFAGVLCAAEAPAMIAVDIPIGLPPQAGRGGPAAENMVRPLLGERQSSAFSVPFATATQLTVPSYLVAA
jgi:predicted RNase H-like nuclease